MLKLYTENKSPKIAVLGDFMLDEYIFGDVVKISIEAPIPVVNLTHTDVRLGGAGNVCNNLKSMGGNIWGFSVIGSDIDGSLLKQMLSEKSINTEFIERVPGRVTTKKSRIIGRSSHQMLRLDSECTTKIFREFSNILTDGIKDNGFDAIIIQDYAKGVVTQDIIDSLSDLRKSHDFKIFVDPHPLNKLDYKNKIDLIKPNLNEACDLIGDSHLIITEINDLVLSKLKRIGEKLYEKYNCEYIVITLAQHGIIAFENGVMTIFDRPRAKEVYDVCGAGDTVISVITHMMSIGKDLRESILYANIAAGIVVSRFGTVPMTIDDLNGYIAELKYNV